MTVCRVCFAALLRFAVLVAGFGVLLPAAPASASDPIKSLSKVAIEAGKLMVVGRTHRAYMTVKLDGGVAKTRSDSQGCFEFHIAYLPEACMIDLKAGQKTLSAVVANCGPKGLTPQGAWDRLEGYATDDLVTLKGSTWRALADNRSKRPDRKPAF